MTNNTLHLYSTSLTAVCGAAVTDARIVHSLEHATCQDCLRQRLARVTDEVRELRHRLKTLENSAQRILTPSQARKELFDAPAKPCRKCGGTRRVNHIFGDLDCDECKILQLAPRDTSCTDAAASKFAKNP